MWAPFLLQSPRSSSLRPAISLAKSSIFQVAILLADMRLHPVHWPFSVLATRTSCVNRVLDLIDPWQPGCLQGDCCSGHQSAAVTENPVVMTNPEAHCCNPKILQISPGDLLAE